MFDKRKLLILTVVLIAVGFAVIIGVPLSTIFFVGLSMLCPVAMFFGMHGAGASKHNQQSGHVGNAGCHTSSETFDTKRAA